MVSVLRDPRTMIWKKPETWSKAMHHFKVYQNLYDSENIQNAFKRRSMRNKRLKNRQREDSSSQKEYLLFDA